MKRKPRNNEVHLLSSANGRTIVSIVKRDDGAYNIFVDSYVYDEENDSYYWSREMSPRHGLYGTIEEAEKEIRSWPNGSKLISAPANQ